MVSLLQAMARTTFELPTDRPPLFAAAGIAKTSQAIRQLAATGLAAQVIGSYSDKQNYPRGTGRRFYYDEANQAAYNAFRLRNPGRKAAGKYLPDAIKTVQAAGQRAIIGVTPLKHEDPELVVPDLVEWACELGADGVEINTSCPNENSDELLCHDVSKTRRVLQATRQRVGDDPYLIVKVSNLGETSIRRHKFHLLADGVSPLNSSRRMSPTNPETGQPFIEVNDGYAGQSGPVIRETARKNLRSWLRSSTAAATEFPVSSPAFDIWSVGGVDSGYEAYDRVHRIGANMVGAAQALYRSVDPAVVVRQWTLQYEAAEALAD